MLSSSCNDLKESDRTKVDSIKSEYCLARRNISGPYIYETYILTNLLSSASFRLQQHAIRIFCGDESDAGASANSKDSLKLSLQADTWAEYNCWKFETFNAWEIGRPPNLLFWQDVFYAKCFRDRTRRTFQAEIEDIQRGKFEGAKNIEVQRKMWLF